jgi:hypothetical protein
MVYEKKRRIFLNPGEEEEYDVGYPETSEGDVIDIERFLE